VVEGLSTHCEGFLAITHTDSAIAQVLHIEKAVHISSTAAYDNLRGQYLKIYLSDTSDECNGAILTLYDQHLHLAGMLKKVCLVFITKGCKVHILTWE
jgi:hypothetical protein